MIGQRIGNYQVVRQVHQGRQGGAAVVYEALHQRSKQQVAIRVLRRDLSQDQLAGVRLFNDVAALGGVQHRSVLTVHEAGMLPDGSAYIVTEHIEGHSLSARLRGEGGEMDGAGALSIAWQLAGALRAGHQRGVLHGDLRPDGVMLVAEPAAPAGVRVKLPDLGLAWLDGPGPGDGVAGRLPGQGAEAQYLAPEQLQEPGTATPQSDVFSLGAVLYLLLTGAPPFSERGSVDALTAPLRPLREVDGSIPEELSGLVQRMLETNPAWRPPLEQVAAAIERLCIAEGLVPGPAPAAQPEAQAESPKGGGRRGRRLAAIGGALLVAGLGAAVVVGLRTGWRFGGATPLFGASGQQVAAAPTPATSGAPAAPAQPDPAAQEAATDGPAAQAAAAPDGSADTPEQAAAAKDKEAAGEAQAQADKDKEAAAAQAPPAADPSKRPTPVAIDKAPIPPLRLDIGKAAAPAPKKKPGRPAKGPAKAPTESGEAPGEAEPS